MMSCPLNSKGERIFPLNSVLRLSVTGEAEKVQLPETFSDSGKRLFPECGVNKDRPWPGTGNTIPYHRETEGVAAQQVQGGTRMVAPGMRFPKEKPTERYSDMSDCGGEL